MQKSHIFSKDPMGYFTYVIRLFEQSKMQSIKAYNRMLNTILFLYEQQ